MKQAEAGVRYLGPAEVRSLLSVDDVADAIAATLERHRAIALGNPPRLEMDSGSLLVMTARDAAKAHTAVKVLHIDQALRDRGEPSIHGVLLFMGERGAPALVADAGAVTALRTTALVLLASRALARPESSHLAILGAGRQAREQFASLVGTFPIDRVSLWNRTASRAADFADDIERRHPGIRVEAHSDPDAAVRGADLVCCATGAVEPLFDATSVAPDAHVNAVGAYLPTMRELSTDLLVRASAVVADDIEACTIESGEIIEALETGAFARDDMRNLADSLAEPGVREGLTVFKSVGFAVADYAVGELLQRLAAGDGPGRESASDAAVPAESV